VRTIDQVRRRLSASEVPDPPAGARRAAVLVLLSDRGDDIGVVYTRRHDDLRHHPGQISFPGGRVEDTETIERAAVREAQEEIGLDPASVRLLGRLPSLYIPPSRFWLTPVVALWEAPHVLVPEPGEVARVLHSSLAALIDEVIIRAVQLSSVGWSWAWQLDPSHLLWGATGRVTEEVLDLFAPGWAPESHPSELPRERLVRPWLARPAPVPRRLPDLRTKKDADVVDPAPPVSLWSDTVVDMAEALVGGSGSVLVLIGSGGDGALASAAGHALEGVGHRVRRLHAAQFAGGAVDAADLVVDGLVGRGLRDALHGPPLAVMHALRTFTPKVLAVDVPTGLDPVRGLIGEVLPADVTMTFGQPADGLLHPGMGVFTGDVVTLVRRDGERRPVVVEPPIGAGWRE
jgi:8-oxo-dGTP pyrophosphatase MutT (NUDIX family)/NAD(P)H-hydrate repair Nnr-like enzyme with NAD(P)H-hydrate epimerase domain